MRRWLRRARRLPSEAAADVVCVAVVLYVLGAPLLTARYPLMTDLPMHAAHASMLRHYFDADWHFREQVMLQPFAVPYMLFYLVAAGFMFVLPTMAAVKAAVFVMLALLPIGLAILLWGMRKSPQLGIAGLLFAWGTLSSWGFLNFVAALGIWAMVVGVALRAVDRPPREATVMLAGPLALLFFTHPFRFPMAVAATGLVALLSHRLRGRGKSLVPALAGSAVLGVVWWLARPAEMTFELGDVGLDFGRLALTHLGEHPYATMKSGADAEAFRRAGLFVGVLAAVLFGYRLRRKATLSPRGRVALGVVVACALAALVSFLALPMGIGSWWFVYPRELTAAGFMALALLPDLPRRPLARLAGVGWLAAALVPLGVVAVESHRAFDAVTADFAAVSEHIPHAPRLMYLVFDHTGAPSKQTPFIHLPAYVQAEEGGWISFSFAWLGHSPFVFRDPSTPGAVVPPRPPERWEWTPNRFSLPRHGRFYDWFLVRARHPPDRLFATEPTIRQVAHEGTWWLYARPDAL